MVKKGAFSPTMKDVAREAGVSLGTVSKVINGIPVGEDYRRRVDAAIERLGYTVNNYARGLKIPAAPVFRGAGGRGHGLPHPARLPLHPDDHEL